MLLPTLSLVVSEEPLVETELIILTLLPLPLLIPSQLNISYTLLSLIAAISTQTPASPPSTFLIFSSVHPLSAPNSSSSRQNLSLRTSSTATTSASSSPTVVSSFASINACMVSRKLPISQTSHLVEHLATQGYIRDPNVPCLFAHLSNCVAFTLIVDDFGVKYSSSDSFNHLVSSITSGGWKLKMSIDATKYIGLTLAWDYRANTLTMSPKALPASRPALPLKVHRPLLPTSPPTMAPRCSMKLTTTPRPPTLPRKHGYSK